MYSHQVRHNYEKLKGEFNPFQWNDDRQLQLCIRNSGF